MLLRHLLAELPAATVRGSDDIEIGDIVYDSRQVTPGALFVSVPSVRRPHDDGFRYVKEALERGAVAVVRERGEDIPGVTAIWVPEARVALGDLAAAFYDHPSRSLQLYGVTGTDGKTTSTYLLEQILTYVGHSTGLIGTAELKIGDQRYANLDRMTTPEAPELQNMLHDMREAGVTHAAMEVSSHALTLQRVRGCQFAARGLTNITADHVEFHGSWEEYFQAKASFFTNHGRGTPAILNRDDEHFCRLREMISDPMLTYGLSPEAEVRASGIVAEEVCTRFGIEYAGERAEVTIPLPGTFNVSNALAAASLALVGGVRLATIAEALSQAAPPPGRMQRVNAGQPFEVLVDYAHTMHAFRSVLATLRERTTGRLIAVFGATGDRDRAKRPILARLARQYADFFFVTNEDPYGEDPAAIIDEVAAGVPSGEEGTSFVREPDRGRAIERAIACARPGDTIVILGKGHEQSMVVKGRKEDWSDLRAARQALEATW